MNRERTRTRTQIPDVRRTRPVSQLRSSPTFIDLSDLHTLSIRPPSWLGFYRRARAVSRGERHQSRSADDGGANSCDSGLACGNQPRRSPPPAAGGSPGPPRKRGSGAGSLVQLGTSSSLVVTLSVSEGSHEMLRCAAHDIPYKLGCGMSCHQAYRAAVWGSQHDKPERHFRPAVLAARLWHAEETRQRQC